MNRDSYGYPINHIPYKLEYATSTQNKVLLQDLKSGSWFSCCPKTVLNNYSKTCVKRPLSNGPIIGFRYQLSLNASQKFCRMLQGEHSAILLTFIKLPFVIKIVVLSIFDWPFYIGFTVCKGNFWYSLTTNYHFDGWSHGYVG